MTHAIPILERNQDKIDWEWLSYNRNAISILEKNLHKIDWVSLSSNPNAGSILEQYPDRIDWGNRFICHTKAVNIIEKYSDTFSICQWTELSKNSNALHLIVKYDYEAMKTKFQSFSEELAEHVFYPERLMHIVYVKCMA